MHNTKVRLSKAVSRLTGMHSPAWHAALNRYYATSVYRVAFATNPSLLIMLTQTSDTNHSPNAYEMSYNDPLGNHVIGYPRLACQMEIQPETTIFKRFVALNSKNLLYLQAEISF